MLFPEAASGDRSQQVAPLAGSYPCPATQQDTPDCLHVMQQHATWPPQCAVKRHTIDDAAGGRAVCQVMVTKTPRLLQHSGCAACKPALLPAPASCLAALLGAVLAQHCLLVRRPDRAPHRRLCMQGGCCCCYCCCHPALRSSAASCMCAATAGACTKAGSCHVTSSMATIWPDMQRARASCCASLGLATGDYYPQRSGRIQLTESEAHACLPAMFHGHHRAFHCHLCEFDSPQPRTLLCKRN